jgi:hypothetical protein
MVIDPAKHEHEHEPAPAQFGAPARVSAGKYVTINYTLRTNGAIRHIRSAVWGDEPLAYQHGSGKLLPALERALEGKIEGERFELVLPLEESSCIAGFRRSCRFSRLSGPRCWCVGIGLAFAAIGGGDRAHWEGDLRSRRSCAR